MPIKNNVPIVTLGIVQKSTSLVNSQQMSVKQSIKFTESKNAYLQAM